MKTKLLVVVGPTASGKTKFAVELAKRFSGEVVSADSMQIYKDMNIATAKPDKEEMSGIVHHLMDFLDISEKYSVGQFVLDANNVIDDIVSRGKLPIICGGTGLYVDSLLNDIDFEPESTDEIIHGKIISLLEEKGIDHLLSTLGEFDPEAAQKLSVEKNTKRVVRAIEFYKTTGKTISSQIAESKSKESRFEYLGFLLCAKDRKYLYDRINLRVDLMLQNGLLDEAKNMLASELSDTSSKAIGYKQLEPYFDKTASLEECVERLKTETRHYAKRQLTWFRRNKNLIPIYIDELIDTEEQINFVQNKVRGFLNG